MEEKVFGVLRSIGLSRNEIIVYLDLISRNESSAREISNRTKLHRANTYEALKGLSEIGFISEIVKEDNKRMFQAEHPRKLKDFIKQKDQEIDEILPIMHAINKEENIQADSVYITKGLFATRNNINALLDYKTPIDVYGFPSDILDTLGEGFLNDFHKQRIRKRIPVRMVFNQNFSEYISKLNKLQYTEARFLNLLYSSFAVVFICENTVLLALVSKNISTVVIKNKEIADSYRGYFGVLWENANKQTSVV
jgi:sugar-specific transcriptional regulator TrmB